jgi:predicted HicB family RNase H-like nuclease
MTISKRPGRPRIDPEDPAPSAQIHVRISSKQYDQAYSRAAADRISVPELLRRTLREALAPAPGRLRYPK